MPLGFVIFGINWMNNPFQQCHFRSFNSFSKVLFVFPSRYFFAISFPIVFRLWCVLSPFQFTLPSKSTLFLDKYYQTKSPRYKAFTLYRRTFHSSSSIDPAFDLSIHFGYTSRRMTRPLRTKALSLQAFATSWFYQLGLCLVHSPLLETSLLFSIPSLIDMLKLWEFSYSFQIQLSMWYKFNVRLTVLCIAQTFHL